MLDFSSSYKYLPFALPNILQLLLTPHIHPHPQTTPLPPQKNSPPVPKRIIGPSKSKTTNLQKPPPPAKQYIGINAETVNDMLIKRPSVEDLEAMGLLKKEDKVGKE